MKNEVILISGYGLTSEFLDSAMHELSSRIYLELQIVCDKDIDTKELQSCRDSSRRIHYLEKFHSIDRERFAAYWEFKGVCYAVFKDFYEDIIKRDMIPILLLPPDNAIFFLNNQNSIASARSGIADASLSQRAVFRIHQSFFIYDDGHDILLRLRKLHQEKGNLNNEETKEEQELSMIMGYFSYVLKNKSRANTLDLIDMLALKDGIGGGLTKNYISKMLGCNLLFVDGSSENVSYASYDLTLDDDYFYGGEIKHLDERHPFIQIEPYDYAIACVAEDLNMPRDIMGRFDLSVSLFCQGIIMSNSTQVDPGFRGKLLCLLFNTSNKPVFIKRNTHFATIEFIKLIEIAPGYSGKYSDIYDLATYIPNETMRGAMNELKMQIEELKAQDTKMQELYLVALQIVLAIIAIILVLR